VLMNRLNLPKNASIYHLIFSIDVS